MCWVFTQASIKSNFANNYNIYQIHSLDGQYHWLYIVSSLSSQQTHSFSFSLHTSPNTNPVTTATKLDAPFLCSHSVHTPLRTHLLTTDPILDTRHFLHPHFSRHRTHSIIRPMPICFFFLSLYLTDNTTTNSGNHPGCLTSFPLSV